jgi:hypothetical protein
MNEARDEGEPSLVLLILQALVPMDTRSSAISRKVLNSKIIWSISNLREHHS